MRGIYVLGLLESNVVSTEQTLLQTQIFISVHLILDIVSIVSHHSLSPSGQFSVATSADLFILRRKIFVDSFGDALVRSAALVLQIILHGPEQIVVRGGKVVRVRG